jgi:alpha-L-rhamnosidase
LYGTIEVNWTKEANSATFHIEVPVNTSANIYIPANDRKAVFENETMAENSEGIKYIGTEKSDAVGNYVIYEVGSGSYNFKVDGVPKVSYPEPINKADNLALIARMNASSMTIQSEKLPVFEAFRANDENIETHWKANTTANEWLEVEWFKPQTFNQIIVDENLNNITAYKLQYWENGAWKDIVAGNTCGTSKTHQFDAVRTTKCRVLINDAKQAPSITELKIYKK